MNLNSMGPVFISAFVCWGKSKICKWKSKKKINKVTVDSIYELQNIIFMYLNNII